MTRNPLTRCTLTLAVSLLALTGLALAGRAAAPADTPRSIARDLEPVVVRGADVPLLLGAPRESLFVYAYRGGGWEQVPFQVDRVVAGIYTSTVGGLLGPEDEVVFMALDLGDLPAAPDIASALPIGAAWYQVEVTDSLSPTAKGWATIVRSSSLTRTFTQTYASFDPATARISTAHYAMGFAATHFGFDYLALNGSGVDIVDRSKMRIALIIGGPLTEESIGPVPISVTRNGPVRVIIGGGASIGYRSLLAVAGSYPNPLPQLTTGARLSMDFAATAVTSTFYNANTPAGVPVDGGPDVVAVAPLSPWWQVAGDTGTLVQVTDASGTGGTQINYYKDDASLDPNDTGDGRSYGDTGIEITPLGATVVYRSAMFVLPPDMPNVGAAYAAYATNPLLVTATLWGRAPQRCALPLVLRGE
jgi:hypothetical protein